MSNKLSISLCSLVLFVLYDIMNAVTFVLQDYLVLLPQDYYEAPMLREKITQPCTYLPTASRDAK